MRKFKKALAVALSVAMMVPTVAFAAESPAKVDVNGAKFNKTTLSYTAKAQKPSITVNGKTLVYGKDFTVKSGRLTQKAAGTYKVTIAGIGSYTGTKTLTYTIKKAAQSKAKFAVNSAKKKVAVSGIKAKAKVTYTTNNKKVSVKNGKIIVKKGVKKGTKVTITAKIASTKNYAAKTIKKTYVVK